ncbi:hypothetical protein KEM56_005250 [Ascosphaera pollenicola]|nr:hypothetical protein KEM56_005250 [Ascosphaera pollenicola]
MAINGGPAVPTTSSLPDSLRIPSGTPALLKYFNRLSRQAILAAALSWLDERHVHRNVPYLSSAAQADLSTYGYDENDEVDAAYPPARDVQELRELYDGFRKLKGGKREVIDRILEGDWRHGISLGQLAMLDTLYLEEHPNGAQKWTAFRIEELLRKPSKRRNEDADVTLPRLHPATFLQGLQREIAGLVKAHFHIHRSSSEPITYVRIFAMHSPFTNPRASKYVYVDSSRVIYLAFPDSAPFVYASFAPSLFGGTSTTRSSNNPNGRPALLNTDTITLRRLVRDAIPKALSRPHCRYTLHETGLTSKNLHSLLALRGAGRTNNANGAYSTFADAVVENVPLDVRPTMDQASATRKNDTSELDSSKDTSLPADKQVVKKRKVIVQERFGTAGKQEDGSEASKDTTPLPVHRPVLERFEVHLQDPVAEGDDRNQPTELTPATISVTFGGTDVISGIRLLAEKGIIDASQMPSYLTGEEGTSLVQVKNKTPIGAKKHR